jgi:hypothetical protein
MPAIRAKYGMQFAIPSRIPSPLIGEFLGKWLGAIHRREGTSCRDAEGWHPSGMRYDAMPLPAVRLAATAG